MITLTAKHLHHERIRRQHTGFEHCKDAWGTSAHKRNPLFILRHRLVLIACCDVPEDHTRKLVAMLSKQLFRILEIGQRCIFRTPVEFHIRNDVQRSRHLILRHLVLHRCRKDQLKHLLDVRVGHLIIRCAAPYFFIDVPALDLYELRRFRECDEVIAECSPTLKLEPLHQQ